MTSEWCERVREFGSSDWLSLPTARLENDLSSLVPDPQTVVPDAQVTSALVDLTFKAAISFRRIQVAECGSRRFNPKANVKNNFVLGSQFVLGCLHYNVLPASELIVVYEPFFQLLRSTNGKLRTTLCELLARITSLDEVKPFRIRVLKDLIAAGKASDLHGPVALMKKFKFLRPDLVPENLSKYSVPSAAKSRMSAAFQNNYPEQNPFEEDLDRLIPQGKLSWTQEILVRREKKGEEEHAPPRPKRQKIQFPTAEENPLSQKSDKETSSEQPAGIPLSKCSRVEELFRNLEKISTPAQTLSLLRQRSAFMFLTLNRNPKQVQTRFSLTLYHTLFNEFFGSNASSSPARKRYILERCAVLQEFLQQGVPVVTRFLSEYLVNWDGKEFLINVLSLIAVIQITEFEELRECILSPLLAHFCKSFSLVERTIFLVYLGRLVVHWVTVEYERCKNSLQRVFGTANAECRNPLESIDLLIKLFVQYAEMALEMAVSDRDERIGVFFNECLTSMMTISRAMIMKKLPLRLDMPASFGYHALFSLSPAYLSRVVEHVTMTKHETVPICHKQLRHLEQMIEEGDMARASDAEAEREVVLKQLEDKDTLNILTKDLLAVLSCQIVYLDRGKSLFRQHWELEDDLICENLGVSSHIMFLPLACKFAEEFARKNGMHKVDVLEEMKDEHSLAHESYVGYLNQHYPRITEFLETFQRPGPLAANAKNYAQSQTSQKSQGTSVATSGISSMQPTNRRKSSRKK